MSLNSVGSSAVPKLVRSCSAVAVDATDATFEQQLLLSGAPAWAKLAPPLRAACLNTPTSQPTNRPTPSNTAAAAMAAVPLIGHQYAPLVNRIGDRCLRVARDRRVLGLALAIFVPALLAGGAVLRWYEGWNMPPLHKSGVVDAAVVIEPRPHPDLLIAMANVCAMTSLPIVAVVGPGFMRAARQAQVRRAVPCNVTFVGLPTDHLNPRQYSSTLLGRTWLKDELFQGAFHAGEPDFWERLGLPDSATILTFQVRKNSNPSPSPPPSPWPTMAHHGPP